jgi:hypothetical protein
MEAGIVICVALGRERWRREDRRDHRENSKKSETGHLGLSLKPRCRAGIARDLGQDFSWSKVSFLTGFLGGPGREAACRSPRTADVA